eukprot:maker-scaffold_15-snap-gene-10.79-mRNA-1 protein AED:0.00 eAED:0.00 QI:90/1/1/1/1/1/2/1146/162
MERISITKMFEESNISDFDDSAALKVMEFQNNLVQEILERCLSSNIEVPSEGKVKLTKGDFLMAKDLMDIMHQSPSKNRFEEMKPKISPDEILMRPTKEGFKVPKGGNFLNLPRDKTLAQNRPVDVSKLRSSLDGNKMETEEIGVKKVKKEKRLSISIGEIQ